MPHKFFQEQPVKKCSCLLVHEHECIRGPNFQKLKPTLRLEQGTHL
jgi:hypothetical protein